MDECRRCADDVHVQVTPGAVLHEIRQLRQEQLCIKPKMASLLSNVSHTNCMVINKEKQTSDENWLIYVQTDPNNRRTKSVM